MSKKSSAKEIIIPTITLFIIALISAVLLAGLNSLTAPIISENNLAAENESRQTVLPAAVNFNEKQQMTVRYITKAFLQAVNLLVSLLQPGVNLTAEKSVL